jgi:hypothetical protein
MGAFARTLLIVVLCCHALDVSSAKSLDDQVLTWAVHAAPLRLSVFSLSSIPFFFPFSPSSMPANTVFRGVCVFMLCMCVREI